MPWSRAWSSRKSNMYLMADDTTFPRLVTLNRASKRSSTYTCKVPCKQHVKTSQFAALHRQRVAQKNRVIGYCKSTRIIDRWQTHVMCCITANVLQTNKVDAQCDKLVTELSWQRFASKVTNLQLSHLYLTCPTCIWRLCLAWSQLNFGKIFGTRKPQSPGYRVALFAWSYV